MGPSVPLELSGIPTSVSRVAEFESWRREHHRPATYLHKWWARRLGTVVQACLVGSVPEPSGHESPGGERAYGTPLTGLTVFDPFAGSGTTLVEARKLGARVVGRDINPIATLTQRQAFQSWDGDKLRTLHESVRASCQADVDELYVTSAGERVLQYFWVAIGECSQCQEDVELFTTRIFAKHAYPKRFPRSHSVCPHCRAVGEVTASAKRPRCSHCQHTYSTVGPVSGRKFKCSRGHVTVVITSLNGQVPERRLYAKLVLCAGGNRQYRGIDEFDRDLYQRAEKLLANAAADEVVTPVGALEAGINTRQALNWGYADWASFYNARQAYSLGRIAAALKKLDSSPEREALIAAFGRTVEHHNLFCSYKGEGTGPVRSIFHNHVLRPERCNVEGNPWGSDGGSGGFQEALTRLEASTAYKRQPTDIVDGGTRPRAQALDRMPLEAPIATTWDAFQGSDDAVYVSTGDAATTDLPDCSIDIVCTDPPYVDNVHYSELADFFDAWMCQLRPFPGYPECAGTRSPNELQNSDPAVFEEMAVNAWKECHRVLKDEGILVFSFHQSKMPGWLALMRSLSRAGFIVTATRPVVAEVSSSLTKGAAALPNRIDVIIVARKSHPNPDAIAAGTLRDLLELHGSGMTLGVGDVLSAMRAAVLAEGKHGASDWPKLAARAESTARQGCREVFGSGVQLPAETADAGTISELS